jgi:hypothetical protein
VGCFAVAAIYLAWLPFDSRYEAIAKVESRIDDLNSDEDEREEFLDQLADVRDWQKRQISVLDHLYYLRQALPEDRREAYLGELRLSISESEGAFSIEMNVKDEHVATKVTEEVVKIKANEKDKESVFQNPKVGRPSPGKDPKYPVRDEMVVPIRSLVEEKTKRR